MLTRFVRALFQDFLLALFAMAMPLLMVWAHAHRDWVGADGDAVWLVRVVSPVLLPFAAVFWLLISSYIFRRRTPGFLVQLLVFVGTIAIEILCLRAGLWI